jgi:hypothetical protein
MFFNLDKQLRGGKDLLYTNKSKGAVLTKIPSFGHHYSRIGSKELDGDWLVRISTP